MNKLQNILMLLTIATFLSCNNNTKKEAETYKNDSIATPIKDSLIDNISNTSQDSNVFKRNNIHIFSLHVYEDFETNKIIGNIPLSDYFGYSGNPDSLVIPKKYLGKRDLKIGDFSPLEVQREYRKRFLEYNDKKETDSIFIFNCQRDTVFSCQIRDVRIIASLNPYFEPDKYPITQDEFMIGFELNKDQLGVLADRKDDDLNFVYVGKSNPFVRGKIKSILWKKVDDSSFQKNAKPFNPAGYEKYPKKTTGTFKFETNDLIYLVQMKALINDSKWDVGEYQGRHLVIYKPQKPDYIIYEQSDVIRSGDDEGYFYPMDKVIDPKSFQWTGAIFKNKPPVIYFNDSQPFGCPSIYFLDSKEPPIEIGCDNRH